MASEARELAAVRQEFDALLARCDAALDGAREDDELLAWRDLLLDAQFESRRIITTLEERLGAFEGEDDPRALATQAEALIEQIEALQDSWESRVDLLLDAGFTDEQIPAFLTGLLARPDSTALLAALFTGLPSDMDQATELLDYGKRYLLSLVVPSPSR